jgi:tryptophan synthase alpha chain
VFDRLRSDRRTGLVTYVTAGDPDLSRSMDVVRALDTAGADVIEVGVPFSDPLADGPVIQRASERALASGATLSKILHALSSIHNDLSAPIVIFTYANPVLRIGLDRFCELASTAGVSGVLLVDLPIEEAGEFRDAMASINIDTIFLLSPTTTTERIAKAAELGRGFLYGISRLGVTGARDTVAAGARAMVGRIRSHTDLPIALGFGISTPDHVREVGAYADAAVVGSALVNVVHEASRGNDLTDRVGEYVRWLKSHATAAGV